LAVVPYATGSLAADITGQSVLSPESLAAAVWRAIAAQYNVDGTMGQQLINALTVSKFLALK
jgi:hypothetical protein